MLGPHDFVFQAHRTTARPGTEEYIRVEIQNAEGLNSIVELLGETAFGAALKRLCSRPERKSLLFGLQEVSGKLDVRTSKSSSQHMHARYAASALHTEA